MAPPYWPLQPEQPSSNGRPASEWLVRDNGAAVRQLGYDPHVIARKAAEAGPPETFVISPGTRLDGQAPRERLDLDETTVDGWARALAWFKAHGAA